MPRAVPVTLDTLEEIGRLLCTEPFGEIHAWLDTRTGELFEATSTYGLDDEDDEDDGGAHPEWMVEERERVAATLADQDRYLRVPIGPEYGMPGVLREFLRTLDDRELRDVVEDATHGRGAFRRVKDALHRRGKLDLWDRFEEERHVRLAREWLEENDAVAVEPGSAPTLRLVEDDAPDE